MGLEEHGDNMYVGMIGKFVQIDLRIHPDALIKLPRPLYSGLLNHRLTTET